MTTLIKQAIIDQKKEKDQYGTGFFVNRNVPEDFLNSKLIKIISGVRRSGKSTLAHLSLHRTNYAYVNFDDERLQNLHSHDLSEIEEALYGIYGDFKSIFFDEIQNVDGWSLFVNRLARKGFNIFLSGSNSKLSSSEISTHLTGRFVGFELFPFSFKEYLAFHNWDFSISEITSEQKGLLDHHLVTYLDIGGFPEIIKGENPVRYASGLFHSIINRDILPRYNVKHQRTFQDIALYMINNYGREISFNRIKNIFGLGSEHTAKNYIHYLEQAYLIFTIPKFSFKKQESIRNKKNYVVDVSLIKSLSDDFSRNTGFIYENTVAIELLRRRNFRYFELYYYKNAVEVDFVIRKNRKTEELIQVAVDTDNPKTYQREVKALLSTAKELSPKRLVLISRSEEKQETFGEYTIEFIPLRKWLLR
jgi:predicted AAA+ superfamily ATPase